MSIARIMYYKKSFNRNVGVRLAGYTPRQCRSPRHRSDHHVLMINSLQSTVTHPTQPR